MPSAPVPANRSSTAPSGGGPRMLKMASRTLAAVGRVCVPRGAFSRRPRSIPPVRRMLAFLS